MNPSTHFAAVLVIAAAPAFADTRTYDISGFSGIETASGVTVVVTAGQDFAVVGEARHGNIKRLRIVKRGDQLEIDRKRGWGIINLFRNDRFVVTISMPKIDAASASSGSSLSIDAAGTIGFDAEASSGASLSIEDIGGGDVDLDVSSGADVHASGKCSDLNAQASSGAALSAAKLKCRTAEIEASSGASIEVSVSQSIDGSASSGASVSISGNPVNRDIRSSSGASIDH